MAIAPPIQETDLVRLAQDGDRAAFQTLYQTYLPKVYDFVSGMLRNRSDAEDATSETFLLAVEQLGDLREPGAFKSWLYTIARHAALRVITARNKAIPLGELAEGATAIDGAPVPQPDERAEQNEMRDLLEDAASTLGERERNVFDLTIRHGLGSSEVARVLDVRPAYAYILVNRLKGSVGDALEAVVLARVGSESCPGLAAVLEGYRGEVSPRMRKAVSRHARACQACGETKRHRASISALVAGSAFGPSAAFAAELGARIDAHWELHTPNGPTSRGPRGPGHLIGAAIAVVLFAGTAFGMGAQRTIAPEDEEPIQPVAETLQVAVTPEPTPEVTARPARRAPAAPRSDRAGGATVTLNNNSGGTQTQSGESGFSSGTDVTSESTGDHPTEEHP